MDWSDTILFEHYKKSTPVLSEEVVQVFPVQGVTLLQARISKHNDTESANESLRGFRAARRVVLCDTAGMSDTVSGVERQLGHALARDGEADLVVSCGRGGRDVAVGARDEGLPLANVVVCNDARSACEVLANQVAHGDTVLLMGVDDQVRARLVLSLEKRLADESYAKAA